MRELLERRPVGGFRRIMADPPWEYLYRGATGPASKGPDRHYATMTAEELEALPLASLAADNCLLWLWTTGPHLMIAGELVKRWGFTYKTAGWWSKHNPETHKLSFGTGYILRNAGEPFLIATRGRPRTVSKSIRNTLEEKRREHSRKPDSSYRALEDLIPQGPGLDLFSRQERPGWIGWGNETSKFPPMAAEPPAAVAAE